MNKEKAIIKFIFLVLYGFLFFSRILVLTDHYFLFINPLYLEILYLIVVSGILVLYLGINIKINFRNQTFYTSGLLLLHTILWGILFLNHDFTGIIISNFKSQIIFLVIIIFTVYSVIKMKVIKEFIFTSYFVLAIVLFILFIVNIEQLKLINILSIFNKDERYRANFGFAHYNTLGVACIIEIIFCHILVRMYKTSKLCYLSFIYLVPMLLCSASRSAILGLLIYLLLFLYYSFSLKKMNKNKAKIVKVFSFILFIMATIFVVNYGIYNLLDEAQRLHLFTISLPIYLKSGRILFGLGYASNYAFGMGLTNYDVYWLDNGYIYYLISTGILGFGIVMSVVVILYCNFSKFHNSILKTHIFSLFVVYLFLSLFEHSLFSSGSIINYPLLVVFFYYLDNKNYERGVKNEKNRSFNISRITQ